MSRPINLTSEIYRELTKIRGNLITERGENVSYDETVKFLIQFYKETKSEEK